MITQAIILAGGKGERLRPLTEDRHKGMIEIAGKPMHLWQIEWLKSHGITDFILAVGYKHEVTEKFFGDGSKFGVKIKYSVEDKLLGSAGAIKKALNENSDQITKPFIVTNADIITQFDLAKMLKLHKQNGVLITMFLTPLISPWGIVDTNKKEHVIGFREKPRLDYWINGGIYVFSPQTRDLLPEEGSLEYDVFPKIPQDQFYAFKDEGFWKAVDVMKDKNEAEIFLASDQNLLF